MDESQLRTTAQHLGIEVDDTMGEGKLIDEILRKGNFTTHNPLYYRLPQVDEPTLQKPIGKSKVH